MKTIDARRKRRVKELLQKGMELNDAIIESNKKKTKGLNAKLQRIKKHYDRLDMNKLRAKNRKKIEKAKRKRNRRKSPLIPIGFEYKKW